MVSPATGSGFSIWILNWNLHLDKAFQCGLYSEHENLYPNLRPISI